MELLHFKCKVCDDYHDMDRSLPEAFSGWAYAQMLWTDLTDQIPPLSEAFTGSSRTPQAGESRVVKVQLPFTESVGNVFYMEFLPDAKFLPAFHLIRNLGADFQTAAQTECAAIVHCRLTELLAADDFCAWIRVQVLDVIRLPELTKRFPSRAVSQTLETYSSYESCDEIMMQDGSWTEKTWTLQGDMIEKKLMFTDDSGVRHLVRMYVFDYFHQVTYFGNITETT